MKNQLLIIKGKIRLAKYDPAFCGGLEKEQTKLKTEKYAQRIGELQE